MNFSIKKKVLLEALNIASRAVSSTTPLPVLNGIRFFIEDDTLSLISSDSNISIKTLIKKSEENNLEIIETGGIVLDAKYILEIVRKIDSNIVSIEVFDETMAKIYGGNSEFKINGILVSEYPDISFSTSNNSFTLDTTALLSLIDKTVFACSDSDTRPILTGVNFKAEGGLLYVNATDSFRLALNKMKIDCSLNFNITIPAKYLTSIYHSLVEEKVDISIDSQKIIFVVGDSIIETRLLDDAFPDTNKLVPTNFAQQLVVNSKELISAVDRSSFIKSDGKNIVRLEIKKDGIVLTSSNQMGSSYEKIAIISFEGEPFEISCSGKYLLDAIKAIDTNEVLLSFSGDLKPFIVTAVDNNDNIQLISPVRTYK